MKEKRKKKEIKRKLMYLRRMYTHFMFLIKSMIQEEKKNEAKDYTKKN